MAVGFRKFHPERFQDNLRAGWCHKNQQFISTNIAFMPNNRLRITPYEDHVSWSVDKWAIGIEFSIIGEDDERRDPEIFMLNHKFGSCEITTQYRCLLPHIIPLIQTSRRSHNWWIDGIDAILQQNYYFSARLLVVEIPGSHGESLDDFLAIFYSTDGRQQGQIGTDLEDYAWPRRCTYIPQNGKLQLRSTTHTLTIPPTCRLLDTCKSLLGGYREFEALTDPMDPWNVMPLRKANRQLANINGLLWMNGRGAKLVCAAATAIFKEELIARTWHPRRYVEWCLDVEEQSEMLADGSTFEDWREAAKLAEKNI